MTRASSQLFALTALVALSACAQPAAQNSSASEKPAAPLREPTAVRVVQAATGAITARRSVSGTLEAVVDSQIAAQTSGQVKAVLRREGENVKAGEVLVQLDDTGLRQQLTDAQLQLQTAQINLSTNQRRTPETLGTTQSSLESARVAVQRAQRSFDSTSALFAAGGASQIDLDTAKANLAQAQAQLAQAQTGVDQAERANGENLALLRVAVQQAQNRIAQTQRSLAQTTIRAPFSGQVAELSTEVGEFVNVGGRVVRLVDLSSLRARFAVPAKDAEGLSNGAGLTITVAGKRLEGRVQRSAQVAGTNRLVPLYGRFVGGQDIGDLAVGSSAAVTYTLRLASGVIVPTGALQTDSGQNFIYVIKDGKAVRRNVEILGESSGRTAVSGIIATNQVVFPVPGSLQSGEVVRVVTASSTAK
jgi:multidrug efflux pump subunit AcrA (membrane-fusion protein)